MAKSSKSSKKPSPPMGKGKVTPIQVAFIVERFLADNNYTNTLGAFRSEASDLFSKTKGKEVPKGLLGLGDILDEYISLKEQRMMVDQERRRVEIAFHGLSDVMRAFNSPQSPTTLVKPNPNAGSPPQGHTIHGSSVNYAQPPMLLHEADEANKFSTPMSTCSSGGKRTASSSAPKAPPPPKRYRAGSLKDSPMMEGMSSGKMPHTNNTRMNVGNSLSVKLASTSSTIHSPVQGSSIAKRLFNNPPETWANSSSPMTPPVESSSLKANGAGSCSIISSEAIIISPLKNKSCNSVQRSYQHSALPLKSSPEMMNKRDHVKGRLDFDESCAPQSSEEHAGIQSSPSTTDGEAAADFDFDLLDFDFFDGDFMKLLSDIDLDCEPVQSHQQLPARAEFLPCLGQNASEGCLETNQALPNPCRSQKDMDFCGLDTMTTMRSITKRIMISSPSKARSNFSLEQSDSTSKS